MKRITETFRVYEYSRVTEIDDDRPSLRPMPAEYAYDTAEEISRVRGPGLAKCLPSRELKKAGAR